MRSGLFAITCMWATACTAPVGGPHEPSAPARDMKRESDREANSGTIGAKPESSSGRQPPAYSCGDTVLNDQASSGGEQLTHSVPCMAVQPATTAPAHVPPPEPDPSEALPPPDVAAPVLVPPPPPKKKGPAVQGYKPKK
ncbi:MAG TPA: hypothetical protein VGM90_06460 [Kofleriaceae bacterium]